MWAIIILQINYAFLERETKSFWSGLKIFLIAEK